MSKITLKEHWLKHQAVVQPNNIGLQTDSTKYSFLQLFDLCNKIATLLSQKGIKKGNHVSIYSENNLEFVLIINALWFLGAIPIPLNIRLKPNEICKLLEFSDTVFLIIINNPKINIPFSFDSLINFSLDDLKSVKPIKLIEKYNPKNICLMIYSSGSTGEPKLVKLTFNNFYNSFSSSNSYIKHTLKDKWLATLPFYHIGGFSIFTRSFLSGAVLVIPKSLKEIDLIKAFRKFNPSLISLVPTMQKSLLEKKLKPWKELRNVFIGGGPSSENLIMEATNNNWPITLVYGSTETSSMVTYCSKQNIINNGISAGIPFTNVKITIRNKVNKQLLKNKVGKIEINSKSVAHSYYKNSQNSNLQNAIFVSNDLGKIDKNGNLHILGREDDIIISGGENISLNEIEQIISQKFTLNDFTTIPIQDEKWGQSYILIVEGLESMKLMNEIESYLKSNLGGFKLPKKIIFLVKFPRTELGKIKKKELTQKLKLNDL